MKGKADKVNPTMARMAIEKANSRNAVYSQCVILSFRSTGRFNCGFNSQDLQAWIDKNAADLFDAKGNKLP